jgi:hypothetical protein
MATRMKFDLYYDVVYYDGETCTRSICMYTLPCQQDRRYKRVSFDCNHLHFCNVGMIANSHRNDATSIKKIIFYRKT